MDHKNTFSERFANRCAIVTGGASGIGLATVQRLAAEGAKVAIWDREVDRGREAARAIGAAAAAFAVDVGAYSSIEAAIAPTTEFLGGQIDILITSAGITGPNATVAEYPRDQWRRVFDINVHGVFECCQAVLPIMQRRNYGRIVNIASVAGKEGNPNASAYSASKAAVIGLTKSLGKELARTGITANAVTPAAVRTAIFDQMSQQHIDFMLSKIPMGRFGDISEIAAGILWLASEEASFTTAAVLDLSGGRATY